MKTLRLVFSLAACLAILPQFSQAEPLKISYNDWPGWVPWEIAIQKGWFEEEGVEVDFQWIDYVSSFDAFAEGALDLQRAEQTLQLAQATGARLMQQTLLNYL